MALLKIPFVIHKSLDDANARNWPLVVVIDRNIPFYEAVLAQEVYESNWKLNPINSLKFLTSDKVKRQLEIEGHEIEVQVAKIVYGKDVNTVDYRKKEVAALRSSYGNLFKGMSSEQIETKMIEFAPKAITWAHKYVKDRKVKA